jgi:hypothetical protein
MYKTAPAPRCAGRLANKNIREINVESPRIAGALRLD